MTALTNDEIQAALLELKIRFDTAPKYYTKQDYMHLIRCISQVYDTSNNFDVYEILKNLGRIVNSTTPATEDSPEGYSWLNRDNGYMYTKNADGTVSTYIPREGDHFLVLDKLTLYHVVKKTGGSSTVEKVEVTGSATWSSLDDPTNSNNSILLT